MLSCSRPNPIDSSHPTPERDIIMNRRHFLQSTAGLAVFAVAGVPAFAQSKRPIVVGSFAGVFESAMRSAFADPFTAQSGEEITLSIGAPSQWLSQNEASLAAPPIDLVLCSPRDAIIEGRKGNLMKVDAAKLPNLADIPPQFVDVCEGYGVGFDYGAYGFAFHKDRVKNPPKSIREFIERTIAGEWVASLPGLTFQGTPSYLIWSFNDVLGGKGEDITPFIDAMKEMRPNVIFWSGMTDVLVHLESGEADIALYGDGRAWAHFFAGAEWMGYVNPEEGAALEPICCCVPKNAHESTWDFVNFMLDPVAQAAFSEITYFGMTNVKTQYTARITDYVTRWDQGRLVPSADIAAWTPAWLDRWNREIGG